MSVINRMLLELDERQNTTLQKRLPRMVRAVPARSPRAPNRTPALILLLMVSALFAGIWFWWNAPWHTAASAKPVTPKSRPVPPATQAAATTPQTLPLPADAVHPISVAPTPIPAPTPLPEPAAKSVKPKVNAPHKTGRGYLLPARDEAPDAANRVRPATDSTVGIKHVSQE